MKFIELCNNTIISEMARARTEDVFRNVKVDKNVKVTPEDLEKFKKFGTKAGELYLLDTLDLATAAKLINDAVESLSEEYSDGSFLSSLNNALVNEFKKKGMKVPGARMKYTHRITVKFLLTVKAIKPQAPIQSTPSEQEVESTDVNYMIDYNLVESEGIPSVDSAFVNIITTAVTNTFEEYKKQNVQKVSETKLQRDLEVALDTAMSESDVTFREPTKVKIKKAAAGPTGFPMIAVIKALEESGAIHDTKKKKLTTGADDETGEVPVFDPEEDGDFRVSSDYVKSMTGYEPELDFDPERDYGVQFN